MLYLKKITQVLFAFVLLISSCAKKETITPIPVPIPIPTPTPTPTTLLTLPQGWKFTTATNTGLPTGLQVYEFDSLYAGRRTKAFCAVFDSKNTTLEFKPVMAATATKPSTFFAQEVGTSYIAINGGFFGSNQSFSLVEYNNVVSSANVKALTRAFNGNNVSYYPTRAAFGVSSTNTPSIGWVYNVGSGNDVIYTYPNPSPNTLGVAPLSVPTATFPTGGTIWNVASAIGGSPVLVHNNAIRITDAEELIVIDNTSARARTGIGYTSNGLIVMMVIEGGSAPNALGLNLLEFATLLQNMGCTHAINLDGGGSSNMVINGRGTISAGDAGVEREVISAVLIKRK